MQILYIIVQFEVFVAVGVCRIEVRFAYNPNIPSFLYSIIPIVSEAN